MASREVIKRRRRRFGVREPYKQKKRLAQLYQREVRAEFAQVQRALASVFESFGDVGQAPAIDPRRILDRLEKAVSRESLFANRTVLADVFSDITEQVAGDVAKIAGVEATGGLQPFIGPSIDLNARLIKESKVKLVQDLNDAFTGRSLTQLNADQARKITERVFKSRLARSKFWGVDQANKLAAETTQQASLSLGMTRYYWTDRDDGIERPEHAALGDRSAAGETFEFSNPPVSEKDGSSYNPSEAPNCRCTATPAPNR